MTLAATKLAGSDHELAAIARAAGRAASASDAHRVADALREGAHMVARLRAIFLKVSADLESVFQRDPAAGAVPLPTDMEEAEALLRFIEGIPGDVRSALALIDMTLRDQEREAGRRGEIPREVGDALAALRRERDELADLLRQIADRCDDAIDCALVLRAELDPDNAEPPVPWEQVREELGLHDAAETPESDA